jgi:PAS domain S-box-containing protein
VNDGVQAGRSADYGALFRAMPTPYLVMTPDLVILDANPAYQATTGRELEDLVGRPVFEAFPGDPAGADDGVGAVRASVERARDSRHIHVMPVQGYNVPDGRGGSARRFWSLTSIPVLDGDGTCPYVLQRAEDITDYALGRQGTDEDGTPDTAWLRGVLGVESDLYARGLELAAAREAEAAAARRLAALAGVALQLSGADRVEDLSRIVVESGLEALGASHGAVAVTEDPGDVLRPVLVAEVGTPELRRRYREISLTTPFPATVAARTGRTVVLPDRASSEQFSAEMAAVVGLTGAQAWIGLPLLSGGRLLGSLTVGWPEPQLFSHEDVELLEAFGTQCAAALDRILTRQAEQAAHAAMQGLAEALQRSLLTDPPQPERLEIAVRYLPAAQEAQIGGDWYDAFVAGDGSTLLTIGDVTGHDRYAAAAMAQVRNLLRGVAHSRPESPADVLTALDRALRDLAVETLATAVLARIEPCPAGEDPRARLVRWSNAGHPAPLAIGPDGSVTSLDGAPNLLLGVDPAAPRTDHVQRLPPGATLLLYTDGLVERRGAALDDGLHWLRSTVAGLAHLPLQELCDRLLADLPWALEDDVALLALRARP